MKKWLVHFCEVGMCSEHTEDVIVEANTERKAIVFAEKELEKLGYRYYTVESVVSI